MWVGTVRLWQQLKLPCVWIPDSPASDATTSVTFTPAPELQFSHHPFIYFFFPPPFLFLSEACSEANLLGATPVPCTS